MHDGPTAAAAAGAAAADSDECNLHIADVGIDYLHSPSLKLDPSRN